MIRSLFIILAVTGIIAQSFSKMLIVLNFEMNREYIAKNLCVKKDEVNNCCKGSCQLNKQLEEETKKENSSSNTSKEKFETQLYCFTIFHVFFNESVNKEIHSAYISSVPLSPPTDIFHPPQV